MSAKDSKKFYWLKLKKDFFQQHQIKVLKSMPNGRLYALIYLELLAESTSHNGELRYSQMLPYDLNTLASVIDEDVDNLKCAIDVLMKLELVEILEDKTIFLKEISKLIGSETGSAIRKRAYREQVGHCPKNVPKSIEYRVKSKENRVKNIYIPTLEEVETYCKERNNNVNAKKFFDYYSANNWKDSNNKQISNWKLKIITWEKEDKKKESIKPEYNDDNNPKISKSRLDEILKNRSK